MTKKELISLIVQEFSICMKNNAFWDDRDFFESAWNDWYKSCSEEGMTLFFEKALLVLEDVHEEKDAKEWEAYLVNAYNDLSEVETERMLSIPTSDKGWFGCVMRLGGINFLWTRICFELERIANEC